MFTRLGQVAALIAVSMIFSYSASALAADLASGKKLSVQCAVCHGRNGIATNPEAPNLAGEAAVYVEKQLKAFRSGEREHRQMSIIAKKLSDEAIKDLAAWYAAMKVSVELPKVE